MSYNNEDYLKTDCKFFYESFTDEHIPCKTQCPLIKDEICYRWEICSIAKNINKG